MKLVVKCLPLFVLAACGETKTIFKCNKLYQYVNNQGISGKTDKVIEYTVTKKIKAEITDKTDYYQILTVTNQNIAKTDSADIDGTKVGGFSGLENIYYTPETKTFLLNKQFEKKSLNFYYGKFALTGATVALKFRGRVGNDTLNPPTIETGFNVDFAPAYRLNWSTFDPSRKFLGNRLTNYSVTIGALIGIGASDLKNKTNAPGLLSDRKSAIFTYGGIVLFGLNSIGIGYAFGFDNLIGTGNKNWVYQNKVWQGITVSVDLIK